MIESTQSRLTLRQIGKLLNLHHTTVSLALRNSPKLSLATRLKVQKTAESMGYVPDPMLSALNVYRRTVHSSSYQGSVAWIDHHPAQAGSSAALFRQEIYAGAQNCAEHSGYLLEQFKLQEQGMSPARLERILSTRGIQGLLLLPEPASQVLPPFDCHQFSSVAVSHSAEQSSLRLVGSNYLHTIEMIFSQLLALGYRRIGLWIPENTNPYLESVLQDAFNLMQWQQGNASHLPAGKGNEPEYLRSWLNTHRPDAVISDDMLEGRIRALGLQIPHDLGFASLARGAKNSPISGAEQNNYYIGQKAMEWLIELMQKGERGTPSISSQMLVESTWVPGKTLHHQSRTPASRPAHSLAR